MASFCDAREALLLAYHQDLTNDEEFFLLCNLNTSTNFDYCYWNYNRFDLDDWSDEECRSDLRFYKADVYWLFEVLDIPEVLITYNQSKFDGMEGSYIFLKRFSYPCRFCDLVSQFSQFDSLFQNLAWCQMPSQIMFTIISIICYMNLISPGIDLYRYMKKEHP